MPKVEIDESELATLRQVNNFANTALGNPKTRQQMLRIQKAINPDAVIPELDAADSVRGELGEVMQEVKNLTKSISEEREARAREKQDSDAMGKIQKGRDFLVSKGYTAEGVQSIEAMMAAEGILSYAAGEAYWAKLNPAPAPADHSRSNGFFGPSAVDNIKADDYKALWESAGRDESWVDASIQNVLKDFRN